MSQPEGGGFRGLTHLVSYTSDSDEERGREEDEEEVEEGDEEVMESIPEDGKDREEKEEDEEVKMMEQTEEDFDLKENSTSNALGSLASYVQEEPKSKKTGLVSYGAEDDEGRKSKAEGEEVDDQDESWSEDKLSPGDDLADRVKIDNVKLVDSSYLSASMSLPESALSQKIRRLSAEEVTLPPEPPGRCSRHLQEKINNYYKKNLNLNQIIQRRKDFRNPSIYEKLVNFLGVDELGTNYPKDMYDPYSFKESSYYEALAKAQKEEIQKKKEKDKKEKTKVEFVTGMVRKTQIQAPLVTSTTGTAASTSSTNQGTSHGEDKKRKSKWDNPAPSLPAPVPLMQRPIISLITTTITASTVVSTTTSATGAKTTVISSIGTIKKPKLEK